MPGPPWHSRVPGGAWRSPSHLSSPLHCRCEATISAAPSLTIHIGIHMHSLPYSITWPALPLHNNLIYQNWEAPLCLWATPLEVEYHYQKPFAPLASYANSWAPWSPFRRKCPAQRTFVILRERTLRLHRDWTRLKAALNWHQPRPILTPSGVTGNYSYLGEFLGKSQSEKQNKASDLIIYKYLEGDKIGKKYSLFNTSLVVDKPTLHV